MAVQVRLTDNTSQLMTQLQGNVKKALTAMGTEAVKLTVSQMQGGYGKPIWQTGDLQRDVSYEVNRSGENTVDVGNTLEYAKYVHEGTYKMQARHYFRDALNNGAARLQAVAEQYLRENIG